jgi:dTDP-4-dehydrorhamnose reductase
MLGTELSGLLSRKGIEFMGTDRELDITETGALESFIEKQNAENGRAAGLAGGPIEPGEQIKPGGLVKTKSVNKSVNKSVKWIINCAAYTAVDKAEDDEESCRRLNTLGAGSIAALAKKNGARLIHISTDYVFDGKGIAASGTGSGVRPYREEDPANPIGVYGRTKRDGELEVIKNNPRSYIVRTAWLYGQHGGNFVHTMLRLMNECGSVSVVDDQRGSPTWTMDLAEALLGIITAVEQGRNIPYGVYHYTNAGNITWFDFAVEICRQGRRLGLIKKDCAVKPCSSAEYPAKVKRPAYAVLDKTKFRKALGMDIPSWDESLIKFLEQKAKS